MNSVVIVGAGQAGVSLAAKLRSEGYDGAITMIGDEPVPPYQRPPLSKAYLLGTMARERLFLRPESWYADNDVTLAEGMRAETISPGDKTVTLSDGSSLPYDQLALTTGSVPRRLPDNMGGNLAGVFTVRSLADVDAMADEFARGRRLMVIGGGYIGLEAAAVAAGLGLDVTLIEAGPRILGRVACAETADWFRKAHTDHGVRIMENTAIAKLLGDTRFSGVELADGRKLLADFCILGIGITPNTKLAEVAGLTINNGIAVDVHCRTSDPSIWAAGDCASFPGPAGMMRLESVGNAIDMGETVACNMLGQDKVYAAKPWFWSDQYAHKLQIAGLSGTQDRIVTRHGDGGVSFWYYAGERLIAVDAMDDPRAYMVGKRLIESGKSPSADAVGDPQTDLKALLSA